MFFFSLSHIEIKPGKGTVINGLDQTLLFDTTGGTTCLCQITGMTVKQTEAPNNYRSALWQIILRNPLGIYANEIMASISQLHQTTITKIKSQSKLFRMHEKAITNTRHQLIKHKKRLSKGMNPIQSLCYSCGFVYKTVTCL